MAKRLITHDDAILINADQEIIKRQPPVKAVIPLGGQALVQVYDEAEVTTVSVLLPDKAKSGVGGAPQGRVLLLGPCFPKEWGVKIGDRVLLAGGFTPLPKMNNEKRELAVVECHTIKAVLAEEVLE